MTPRDRTLIILTPPDGCNPHLWRDFHRAPRWQHRLSWALVFAAAVVVGLALASVMMHAATMANDDMLNGAAPPVTA